MFRSTLSSHLLNATKVNRTMWNSAQGLCSYTTSPKIQSINPHNGQIMKEYPFSSWEQVSQTLQQSQTAFERFRKTTVAERGDLLRCIANDLDNNKASYGHLISLEMGKPLKQATPEVEKCAAICRYYADNAENMLKARIIESDASVSKVVYDPMGVILQLAPFNFPLWQVFRFAAPAIMAGNVTLVRHTHNVPQSAEAIQALFDKCATSEATTDVLKVLFVDHAEVSKLIQHPLIKGISVTGSTNVGSIIAEQAGKNLKKSVLELGGSDPFIVLADADLEQAADAAIKSRTLNNGQSCIAAKRFLVEKQVLQKFTDIFVEKMKNLKVGNPMDNDTDVGPLARQDLRDKVHTQVKQAVQEGASVLCGGKVVGDPNGFYYAPTVLGNLHDPDMLPRKQEIFGPVASIIEVESVDDAIKIANSTEFGLGATIFTQDVKKAEKMAHEIESGMVFVNGMVKSDPRLPFGGVKNSGYGRECADFGLYEWVNVKTVWIK